MTECVPRQDSFRLLNAHTGWDVDDSSGLTGFDDPAGVRLSAFIDRGDAVHVADLVGCLYPPPLAADPAGRLLQASSSGVRAFDVHCGEWRDLRLPDEPTSIAALAWGGGLLVVADAGARRIDVLRGRPLRHVLRVDLARLGVGAPRLVSLPPWNVIAVVTENPPELLCIGMDGRIRARRRCPEARAAAEIGMVCVTSDHGDRPELLIAVRIASGWRRLVRVRRDTFGLEPVAPSAVSCTPPSWLPLDVDDEGSWRIGSSDQPPPRPPRRYLELGRLRTVALDSGIEACHWHRVRVDADQPPATRISLRAATVADPHHDPEDDDWHALPGGTLDALLVGARPGRYLRVELELTGDGTTTPVVRGIHCDFDVATSADRLPPAYMSDPDAADFTRRFVSLFDASFDDLDDVARLAPLLYFVDGLPAHVLPALASRLGVPVDASWPPDRLRALLRRWPTIAPTVGTPDGLRTLLHAVYDVHVLIDERGRDRPWGAAGAARLGNVRLFDLSRASFRLGTGVLGESIVDPHTDPLTPAYSAGAWRCVVHVPASVPAAHRPGLQSLVMRYLPAHVVATVRYASPAMNIGRPLAVGVGTRIGRLPTGALEATGDHAVVLGVQGPLGSCAGGAPVTIGSRSIVGITT